MRYALLLASLLFLTGSPLRADDKLPPDLAVVPPDCLGFIHIHAADLWKSDLMKDLRDIVQKSGQDALNAFDKRFVPSLTTLDRITIFALLEERRGPIPCFAVSFTKSVDTQAFLKNSIPKARPNRVGDRIVHSDPSSGMEFHFLDDKTLLVGFDDALEAMLKNPPVKSGTLSASLEAAAKNKSIAGAFNTGLLPAQALQELPAELRPLATTKLITFALNLDKEARLEVKFNYANSQQVDEADKSLQGLCKMGLEFLGQTRTQAMKLIQGDGKSQGIQEMPMAVLGLFATGALKMYEEFLTNPPVTKDGNALKLSLDIPSSRSTMLTLTAGSLGLLLPSVQKVRGSAARLQSQNNLKQIVLAMHNYESAYNRLPNAAVSDKKGKPLLSWRVTILPYIEQEALYRQFKLDEPWDSEHNKKLIRQMPKIYQIPTAPMKEGETHYRIFQGKNAGLDLVKPVSIVGITDGTSNTMFCFEAEESVIWTKPEEFEYDPKKPLPKMGNWHNGGFNAAFFDGSVRFLRSTIKESTLRAIITRDGGEIVNADE